VLSTGDVFRHSINLARLGNNVPHIIREVCVLDSFSRKRKEKCSMIVMSSPFLPFTCVLGGRAAKLTTGIAPWAFI